MLRLAIACYSAPSRLALDAHCLPRNAQFVTFRGIIQEYQLIGIIAGVEPLTKDVLKKAAKLKAISRCGTGMDSVDLQSSKDFDIVVTNTDEDALYDALSSGHLGGAALDCFEQEPYMGKLKDLDNVLLTAHIGSYAQEGRVMMERQAVENLLRELKKAGCIE